MKRIITLIFILLMIETGFCLDPQEILEKINRDMYPENIVYTAEMTILRPGKEYKKLIKVYIKGDDNALIEFLEPPKQRGTKILNKKEYCWMYLPSVERVIRLSGRTNLMGGDFIHEDILRVRLYKDYEVVSLKEEDEIYIFELHGRKKQAPYQKIIYFVNKISNIPLRGEFYSSTGRLLKILTYEGKKEIKGRVIPGKLIMENAFSQDYKTILEIKDCNYNKIPDRIFSEEYLKKGL